jgi:hypothetical protein
VTLHNMSLFLSNGGADGQLLASVHDLSLLRPSGGLYLNHTTLRLTGCCAGTRADSSLAGSG